MNSIWKPGPERDRVLTIDALQQEARWLRSNGLSRNQIINRLTPWADPGDLNEIIEKLETRWQPDG